MPHRQHRTHAARADHSLALLDLPSGAPIGVGGIPFETTTVELGRFLDEPHRPLEAICDLLLYGLRHPDDHDDVALLVARPL